MTSMPASRSARAMTFAPRSCPSRPGFATSTRIFRVDILEGGLFVDAEHVAQRGTNLTESGVSAHGFNRRGHRVLVSRGDELEFIQCIGNCARVALCASLFETFDLVRAHGIVDHEDRNFSRLVSHHVLVHPNNRLFAALTFFLIL